MLLCVHKVIESVLANQVATMLDVYGQQFGFQRGLSPVITLSYVDEVVKYGRKRIVKIYLTKEHYKINRTALREDNKQAHTKRLVDMLRA